MTPMHVVTLAALLAGARCEKEVLREKTLARRALPHFSTPIARLLQLRGGTKIALACDAYA